jgi:hypothetical protein
VPLPSRPPLLPSQVLDQVADVYTPAASGGRYTVLARSGLAIGFRQPSASGAAGAAERAELLGSRRVVWAADYAMPEGAQLAVAGQRCNTVRGSFSAPTAGNGAVMYRACDAVQAKV